MNFKVELELPDELGYCRLPAGVQDRLQALLHRQHAGQALTAKNAPRLKVSSSWLSF
jgi:hypothetical protein